MSKATNNTMSIEQLIATFGEEVGTEMFAQMNASTGTGGAPYPFLKKVSTHGSELGDFGTFLFGTKTEKDASGDKVITEKGTNVGKDFEFIIVNVSYRYSGWDEAKGKGFRSNIFKTLDGIKTAADSYTGKALPASKEDKKADGWKLTRINAGLVRANAKAAWEPVIWETTGSLYFSLGEVVKSAPNLGLMSGYSKIVTKLESKGSTQYPVIDLEASEFKPSNIFGDDKITAVLGDMTKNMTSYINSNQAAKVAPAPEEESEDSTNW